MDKIKAEKMRLIDNFGRERIFNGICVCDKGCYNNETGKRDYNILWKKGLAKRLKESGINLIRLGFTWEAVEPEMEKYNDAYMDEIKAILDEC